MRVYVYAPDLARFWEALNRAPELLKTEMLKAEEGLLGQGIAFAAIAAPVGDSGNLRASIHAIEEAHWTGGGVSGAFGTNLIYAAQREFGGPIYAKPGGFLRFEIDGKVIFAKKVNQKGSHYMAQASDQVEPLIATAFEGALDRVFASFGG